jgi:predicted CopG family antitoxin
MRIDADDSLGKKLNKVKAELYAGGKGHSETIRRLIDNYEQNSDLTQILDRRMAEIQKTVETGILDAFKLVIKNLLS